MNLRTYKGSVQELKPNEVFVFGSNTRGAHGKGAALFARQKCGAIYGQARGLQGQSYAIVTKDLTKSIHPSVSSVDIKQQILELYSFAKQHTELEFVVAYSGSGTNLNAYSNQEMANMFNQPPIPENIIFEEGFAKLINKVRIDPNLDGVDHINIYTKGKTWLGRSLSNLSDHSFVMNGYGKFRCVEAFWYYYLTGCQHEELKDLSGFEAKQLGKTFRNDRIDKDGGINDEQKEIIKEAIRCKLRQNKNILKELTNSTLPFKHYYWYGDSNPKIIEMSQYNWMIEEIERIRKLCKEFYKTNKDD